MYLQLCWYCYWKEMMIIEMIWNKLWMSSCLNALLIYWTAMKSYQNLKEARFGNFLISAGQYSFGLLSYCSLSVSLWETIRGLGQVEKDGEHALYLALFLWMWPVGVMLILKGTFMLIWKVHSCECGLSDVNLEGTFLLMCPIGVMLIWKVHSC